MRHEEIQRIYKNHYFLSFKDMGGVRELVGNVDVIVFFVSDSQSSWTDSAKKKYRETHYDAMQYVQRTARQKGVSLQIRNAYVDASLSIDCLPENYSLWSTEIIRRYGVTDIPAYQSRHEAVKQCTEVPILFVFNKPFRSRAACADWATRTRGEMSLISSQYSKYAIIHELFHQFGAVDLYYPASVEALVKRLNYPSVMASYGSMYIDSLTSYLIGWTDEINSSAVQILERTKHFTRDYILAEMRKEYLKT